MRDAGTLSMDKLSKRAPFESVSVCFMLNLSLNRNLCGHYFGLELLTGSHQTLSVPRYNEQTCRLELHFSRVIGRCLSSTISIAG
jgi:hypothetical protein